MATTPAAGGPTQVVVAFLEGRRLRGFVFGFSAIRDKCTVFPSETAKTGEGEEVNVRGLKGIFFIHEPKEGEPKPAMHGRRLEVVFADGERLVGWTEGYSPERLGFFMVPEDNSGKILRVFVVNQNVKKVNWLKPPATT